MEKTSFSAEKMYTYIRGYATGKDMKESLSALAFARKMHNGQLRKSGTPYVVHPLTMACHALSIGICYDETRDYVFPLLRKIKDTYPEYSNQLFSLKYHI